MGLLLEWKISRVLRVRKIIDNLSKDFKIFCEVIDVGYNFLVYIY